MKIRLGMADMASEYAYAYDEWGNITGITESVRGNKGTYTYRCYYYDAETGFYYLNSRYYDPQIRRFISADDRILKTEEGVKGYNLYSYCQNTPLGMADYNGHSMTLTLTLTLPVIGAALSTVAAPIAIEVAIGITTAVTVHNVVMCKRIVDAVVNSNKDKKVKELGEEGTGEGEKGIGDSKAGQKKNPTKGKSKVWKGLDNVKGQDRKTSGKGKNKQYYEWDHTHDDIEVYDRNGRHLGSMDPETGEMYKPAVPGRTIKIN